MVNDFSRKTFEVHMNTWCEKPRTSSKSSFKYFNTNLDYWFDLRELVQSAKSALVYLGMGCTSFESKKFKILKPWCKKKNKDTRISRFLQSSAERSSIIRNLFNRTFSSALCVNFLHWQTYLKNERCYFKASQEGGAVLKFLTFPNILTDWCAVWSWFFLQV